VQIWDETLYAPLTLPHPCSPTGNTIYYVEGYHASSEPCDITLVLTHLTTGFQHRINLTVTDLVVEWVTFMDNDDITDHPATPPNGGKRIFPDKKTYNDSDPERRKIAQVRATISPPVDNRHVYLKKFDVDDESSDTAPIDGNGSVGGDNRAGSGSLSSTSPVTDGNGQATVEFTVTMSPGDNFRVAASLDSSKLQDPYLTQGMADSGVPPDGVAFSPMLTVWRKLHLELDSMAAGQDHPVSNRNVDDTWANQPHTGESGAEINGWSPGLDDGQYEGGTLTISGGPSFEIIKNIDDSGDDTVYVLGDITPYKNMSASFTDDDASQLPRKADWSVTNSKFAPAYIVVEEEAGVYDDDGPFEANVDGTDSAMEAVAQPVRQRVTSPNYWVLQVLSCHQGPRNVDADPDYAYHYHNNYDFEQGEGTWRYGQGETSTNAATIFLETIRDAAAQQAFLVLKNLIQGPAYSATQIETFSVVHEAGHAFGCGENEGGVMNTTPNPSLIFSDGSIYKIRTSTKINE